MPAVRPRDVSVVIPTHERASLALRAIASVLAQNGGAPEIVVVDDCSTDGTPALLAEEFGDAVRVVVTDHNAGAGVARNVGAAAASGSWLAFLDSDDEWEPSKLAVQCAAAESAQVTVTGLIPVDADGKSAGPGYYPPASSPTDAYTRNPYLGLASSILLPRSLFERLGGFPEPRRAQDWLMALRLLSDGQTIHVIPEHLVRYGVHDGNITGDPAALSSGVWNAIDWAEANGLVDGSQLRAMRSSMAEQLARTHARAGEIRGAVHWVLEAVRHGTPREGLRALALTARATAFASRRSWRTRHDPPEAQRPASSR